MTWGGPKGYSKTTGTLGPPRQFFPAAHICDESQRSFGGGALNQRGVQNVTESQLPLGPSLQLDGSIQYAKANAAPARHFFTSSTPEATALRRSAR